MFIMTTSGRMSEIKNPLSGKIRSQVSKKPDCCIISDTEPGKRGLQRFITPFGATEIRSLKECIPLYVEHRSVLLGPSDRGQLYRCQSSPQSFSGRRQRTIMKQACSFDFCATGHSGYHSLEHGA